MIKIHLTGIKPHQIEYIPLLINQKVLGILIAQISLGASTITVLAKNDGQLQKTSKLDAR